MPRHLPWLTLLLLPFAACSERAPAGTEVPIPELDDGQQVLFSQAKDAASRVGQSLVGELVAKMGSEGPVAAVEYCRLTAPVALAAAVEGLPGIRGIGRTSHRLRNPENQPPAWAAAAVRVADGEPHAFLDGEGGLDVLLPIRIQPTCLVCHGDPSRMSKGLRGALSSHYPEDQAIGFGPDELRGWFWVEVAAPEAD